MMKVIANAAALLLIMGSANAGGLKNVHSYITDGATVEREPGPGAMQFGQIIYVNDGSCPAGKVKQVTAGSSRGTPRTRSCVTH